VRALSLMLDSHGVRGMLVLGGGVVEYGTYRIPVCCWCMTVLSD
jgi:hypothetical protein